MGDQIDFGARIYDARVGRWLSPDPLEGQYIGIAPYVFVHNQPIINADINGKEDSVAITINDARSGHATIIRVLRSRDVMTIPVDKFIEFSHSTELWYEQYDIQENYVIDIDKSGKGTIKRNVTQGKYRGRAAFEWYSGVTHSLWNAYDNVSSLTGKDNPIGSGVWMDDPAGKGGDGNAPIAEHPEDNIHIHDAIPFLDLLGGYDASNTSNVIEILNGEGLVKLIEVLDKVNGTIQAGLKEEDIQQLFDRILDKVTHETEPDFFNMYDTGKGSSMSSPGSKGNSNQTKLITQLLSGTGSATKETKENSSTNDLVPKIQ